MPPEEKAQQQGTEADVVKGDEGEKDGARANSKGWEAAEKHKAENADLKKRLAKLEADKQAQEEAKLKEAGKYQELATSAESKSKTLEAQLRRERIERAIVSAAAGANDPEDVIPFVSVPDDLELGDRDALNKHVKSEIKKLKESKPYLFRPADSIDKNTTVNNAPPGNGKDANFDPSKVRKGDIWGLNLDQMKKVANQGRG